jgi:hypothetical protein
MDPSGLCGRLTSFHQIWDSYISRPAVLLGYTHYGDCSYGSYDIWHSADCHLYIPSMETTKNSAKKVFALLSFDVPIGLTIQNHPKS